MQDGTDVTQDSQQVETSEQQQGTSKNYSQEHVDKLLEKLRSDSLAELGRVRKAAEDAIRKNTESSNTRLNQLIKEQEERELQLAQGNNDALAVIKEKQARRKLEDELAKAREELNLKDSKLSELSTKDQETAKEKRISEIASRLKVDTKKLMNLSKFTDGSAEAIESIANELPKIVQQPANSYKPDNNQTSGGSGMSKYQLMSDYSSGKINIAQYEERMKANGWQP